MGGPYQASEAVFGRSRSPRDGCEREEGAQRREPNALRMGILVAADADAERLLRPYSPSDSHSEPRRLGLSVFPHSSAGGWSSRTPPLQASSGLVPGSPLPVLVMG